MPSADAPNPGKRLITLGVELIKYQAKKQLGDGVVDTLAEFAADAVGEDATAKLTDFLDQGQHAAQLLAAFQEADAGFAEDCHDPDLKQAIASEPLAGLPTLEKMAGALPETLDDAGLLQLLRDTFQRDWPALTGPQLDQAAAIYRHCLDRALAAKCDQLLPTIFRKIERIDATTTQMAQALTRIERRQIDQANLGQVGLARQWLRPEPPRPSRDLVGRTAEREQLRAWLTPGAGVGVTVAVSGLPGAGKTLLAETLAAELDAAFSGGVLFERLGAGFRSAELANPILNRWGTLAYNGQPLKSGDQLTPGAVRALLAGHGPLLVVLDDVWRLAAIQPLRDALPLEAALLLTTRNDSLAADLHGRIFELDALTPADALALLRTRIRAAGAPDDGLLSQLAAALGWHSQALDLAGRSLDRLPKKRWPEAVQAMRQQVQDGTGFGELHLPGDETRASEVEAALKFSYDDLDSPAQARFRRLGAFAPDGGFSAAAAAGLWHCPADEAELQLAALAERGLLFPLVEGELWRQHSLLRAYALGLLRRAQEEDEGRRQQATTYLGFMQAAHNGPGYYHRLLAYRQLQHAFDWAVKHDLALAQALAANTEFLQASYNLARDRYAWAYELLGAARQAGEADIVALALGSLGNALAQLADVPGEDRGARLREGLAIYAETLKAYPPSSAARAYAGTQNNRANLLKEMATLPGEDRAARLREALAAYADALKYGQADVAPHEYAMTQNNRSILLSDMAALSVGDRAARLKESLAASDEALKYYRPEIDPFGYARVLSDRASRLSDMATLPGENRAARLYESLAASDEALKVYQPEMSPLDYARVQSNRANRLMDIATLPGENLAARLHAALAASDEALKYRRPEAVPLAYALTQESRASLLSKIAVLPGEDRAARLHAGLRACDEALKYYQPETSPLDYASTQNNRANLLSEMADLPGEDAGARLRQSLAAYDELIKYQPSDTSPLDYAKTQTNRASRLRQIAALPGEDRGARLREALAASGAALKYRRLDVVPSDFAWTQFNRAMLHFDFADTPGEDRHANLVSALRSAYAAYSVFSDIKDFTHTEVALNRLAFVAVAVGASFSQLWAEATPDPVPAILAEYLEQQGHGAAQT